MKKIIFFLVLLFTTVSEAKDFGIDVSHYNKLTSKDWNYLVNSRNIKFIFIKASDGKNFRDPMFITHYNYAKKYKLKVGAYHFYRDNVSPALQFNNFQKAVKNKHLDLIPVIDFEPKGFSIKYSKYDRIENLRLLINLFESHYKVRPIIYCSSIDYYVSYRELRYLSNLFWINNFKSYLVHNNNHINQYKINLFKKELDFNEVSNINKYNLNN